MSTQPRSTVVNKQQCSITSLYRVWFGYGAGFIIFLTLRNWILLTVWALAVPLAKWLQIRFYPYLSKLFGYGEVEDRAPPSFRRTSDTVTFYHALGCPFCPIVSSRLKALQREIGFTLNAVDVTLHPKLLANRGIHINGSRMPTACFSVKNPNKKDRARCNVSGLPALCVVHRSP